MRKIQISNFSDLIIWVGKYLLRDSRGYTLVEMVTVGLILVTITGVIAAVLTSTLRGTNKSKVTSSVSQNGNYALSVISNIFISTKGVEAVEGNPVVDCSANPSGISMMVTRSDGGTTLLSCDLNSDPPTISSNGATLIDTSVVQVDSDKGCHFSCIQNNNAYSAPLLEVGFSLKQKGRTGFSDSSSTQDFTTQVLMRNFTQE